MFHPHRSEHLHKIHAQVGRHEPDSAPVRQKGKSLHVLMENKFMEILVRISSNPFQEDSTGLCGLNAAVSQSPHVDM